MYLHSPIRLQAWFSVKRRPIISFFSSVFWPLWDLYISATFVSWKEACVCVCVCIYIYIYTHTHTHTHIHTYPWKLYRIYINNCPTKCNTNSVFIILQPATRVPPQPSHTETPTHVKTRTHDQCGDTIEKSQSPDDGYINARNMLSIEEVI